MTRIANPKRPNSGMSLAQILLLVGLVVGGLVACITWYVFQLQTRIVETTALDKAQVLSRAVGEFRTIYTAEVVTRLADTGVRVSHDYREHAGAIPLPATLSMLLGSRLGETGTGVSTRLYSPYPFPWRTKSGGLHDRFSQDAWKALSERPGEPFHRIEQLGGQAVLRYATADLLRPACVDCHNTHPQSPKIDWREGEMRGVLEVQYPMGNAIAQTADNLRGFYTVIAAVGVPSLLVLALLIGRQKRLTDHTLAANADLAQAKADLELGRHELLLRQEETEKAHLASNSANQKLEQHLQELDGSRIAALNMMQDMEIAKAAAEEGNQAKGAFLATMSHEIRTPMNGVMGMLQLMQDTPVTTEQKDYLQTAHSSAETLVRLLNDILDFSKIEAGRVDLEIIDFDLRYVAKEVTALFADQAAEKDIELRCELTPDVITAVLGDPTRLRQILSNLLNNAVKFTPSGEIVLRVSQESPGRVRFVVTDTGVGMTEDAQTKIFDRFTQADDTTTRKFGGTGLGLAICKQLVELMGGDIGVDSTLYVGTSIWVTVRLEPAPESPLPTTVCDGTRVLVVDSDPSRRLRTEQMLDSWHMPNEWVESGEAALERLRASVESDLPFQVALIDQLSPEMDELELARTVREETSLHAVRLILVSARALRGDAKYAREAGFDGFLTRPFRQSSLHDCIAVLMGENKPESGRLVTRHALAEAKLRSHRILVVEDNLVNQKVAVGVLKKLGYQSDPVGDGQQALEALANHPYDLVLMDCHMPLMDGYEATRAIRRQEGTSGSHEHLPIIAMTANAMAGDDKACYAAGMDGYLAKPLNLALLKGALKEWLPPPAPEHG